MFCIFCQQKSKIHVLSASPDLHGSFYFKCLLPQARTSDLTYDVGVEVDYFEYILLRGSFFFVGKKTDRLDRFFAFSRIPFPRASIAALKSSGVLPLGRTLVKDKFWHKQGVLPLGFENYWKPVWVQVFSHLAEHLSKTLVWQKCQFWQKQGVLPLGFENHWKPCFLKPFFLKTFFF